MENEDKKQCIFHSVILRIEWVNIWKHNSAWPAISTVKVSDKVSSILSLSSLIDIT